MGLDRDETANSLIQHLQLLKKDIHDFGLHARGWSQVGKGQELVAQLQRDFRQLEARALALLAEVGHMDAMRRQLSGGVTGVESRRLGPAPVEATAGGEDAPPVVPAAPAPAIQPASPPVVSPQRPAAPQAPVHKPPPEPDAPTEVDQKQKEGPLPAPPGNEIKSKVVDLPKHLRDELRRAGLT